MKVLVIGSGGREHALAWKLSQSSHVSEVLIAPGNAGTETGSIRNVPISATDIPALLALAKTEDVALTVVGPDDVLAAGLVDTFQAAGLRVFGPNQAAAKLEWSKIFAKEFMFRHGIPAAKSGHFSASSEALAFCETLTYPIVIKADGLALGKGVVIADSPELAVQTIRSMMEDRQFGDAGSNILIEEFLTGPECSLQVLVDGSNYLLCPSVQDHKPIFDGNKGPNTGGMGTYSPSSRWNPELEAVIRTQILEPFMQGQKADGLPFNGLLFPGLMLTPDGPKVLEFNCRFGDPETQCLMVRLKSDLFELLNACIDGQLHAIQPEWDSRVAVCVILASEGYPGTTRTGLPLTGLEEAAKIPDVTIFHAGTRMKNDTLVSSGGRVLGVTALGTTIEAARKQAYQAIQQIQLDGAQYRTDIGLL